MIQIRPFILLSVCTVASIGCLVNVLHAQDASVRNLPNRIEPKVAVDQEIRLSIGTHRKAAKFEVEKGPDSISLSYAHGIMEWKPSRSELGRHEIVIRFKVKGKTRRVVMVTEVIDSVSPPSKATTPSQPTISDPKPTPPSQPMAPVAKSIPNTTKPVAGNDAPSRLWTSRDKKFSVNASIVSQDARSVTLKRTDNQRVIVIPLTALSQVDRDFLEKLPRKLVDVPMVTAKTPSATNPPPTNAFKPFSGIDKPDAEVPDAIAKLASGATTNEAELVKHCLTFPNAEVRSDLIDEIGMDNESTVDARQLVSILRAGMLDPAVQVRIAATYALDNLEDIDDQHRAEALHELLQNFGSEDADLAQASIDVIHNLGKAAAPAVPRLIQALEQPDFRSHDMVCLTLANIGDPAKQAIPALKRFAFHDQSDDDVKAAFKTLGSLGAEDAILEGLATESYLTLHSAAIGAGWLPKHSPKTVELLLEATRSEFTSVRVAALGSLGAVNPASEAISKLLVESLNDQEEIVRWAAADALAQIRPKFAFARDALLAGIKSDDETLAFKCEDALGNYDSVGTEEVLFAAIVAKTLAQGEFDTPPGAFINQIDTLLQIMRDPKADTMHRVIAFMGLNRLLLDGELDPDQKKIVIDNAISWIGKGNPIDMRLAPVSEYPNEQIPFKPDDDEHGLYVAGIHGGRLRSMREHCLQKCGELKLIAAVPEIIKLLESDYAKDSYITVYAVSALAKMGEAAAPAIAVLDRDLQKFSADLQSHIARARISPDSIKSPGSTKPSGPPAPEMSVRAQRSVGPTRVVEGDAIKLPSTAPPANARKLPPDPEQVPSSDVNVRPVNKDVVALTPYCQIGNFENLKWRLAYREPTTFIAEKDDYTESIVVVIQPRVESQEEKRAIIKQTYDDQIDQWELRDYKIVRASRLDSNQTIRAGAQYVMSAKHPDDDQARENITRIKFDDPNYIFIFKASAKSTQRAQKIIGVTDTFREMPAE